jgi:hypothetical protein
MNNQKNNYYPATLFRIAGEAVKTAELPISDLPKTIQACFANPCCFMHPYNGPKSGPDYWDYWSTLGANDAAAAGHNDCLDYAVKNGGSWNAITTEIAANEGHLSTLAHAHSNGCPMTSDCIDAAMAGGYLPCVQYAHENGCDWSEDSLIMTIMNKHVECFKYGYENGAPYDDDMMNMLHFDDEISDYLRAKGHLPAFVIPPSTDLWVMDPPSTEPSTIWIDPPHVATARPDFFDFDISVILIYFFLIPILSYSILIYPILMYPILIVPILIFHILIYPILIYHILF